MGVNQKRETFRKLCVLAEQNIKNTMHNFCTHYLDDVDDIKALENIKKKLSDAETLIAEAEDMLFEAAGIGTGD